MGGVRISLTVTFVVRNAHYFVCTGVYGFVHRVSIASKKSALLRRRGSRGIRGCFDVFLRNGLTKKR